MRLQGRVLQPPRLPLEPESLFTTRLQGPAQEDLEAFHQQLRLKCKPAPDLAHTLHQIWHQVRAWIMVSYPISLIWLARCNGPLLKWLCSLVLVDRLIGAICLDGCDRLLR
jgi:hypothetical protein